MLRTFFIISLFVLINSENFDVSITYYGPKAKESSSSFDKYKPYKVIFHGYNTNSTKSPYYKPMIEAYQEVGAHVLALEYGTTVGDILYFPILPKVPDLGKQIGETLIGIAKERDIPLESFHFIGHSLGAQIAALTAQHIKKHHNFLISRISGLDPAGVAYENLPKDQRLSEDDAVFVDIIHSNGGEAGYWWPNGDIDFYPNGGTMQNGCSKNPLDPCSHGRAALYFVESILNNNFLAKKCNSYHDYNIGNCSGDLYSYMGEYADRNPSICNGTFYLKTNGQSPFALV